MIKIPENTPTDLILQYRQQGYDDDSIIKALQQQGYNSQQIFDGFNQADLKPNAVATPVQGMNTPAQDKTEEMIESIIEEKWNELKEKLNSFDNWKEQIQNQVTKLEEEMSHIKENYNNLHQGVLGKISEYDNNLKDVGSSVKAMDKVFKNILPTLTNSVNRLARMSGPKPPINKLQQ
ncbi:hypothetical protein KY321_00895 [Candidatus Woesearchaeota archaeon]|nr:hypothetical protein [Candidatus Woesearchaeota archaeon]